MTVFFDPMVLPITLPLVFGALCLLVPDKLERVRTTLAVLGTALTFICGLDLFLSLAPGRIRLFLLNPGLDLTLDSLSGFILLAVTGFGLLSAIYSAAYMGGRKRLREYYAYLLWTVGLSCGAVLANNLILLLVLWGLLGATFYLMVGMGGSDAAPAAKKAFIIVGGSDCFLMLGVVLIWTLSGNLDLHQAAIPIGNRAALAAFLCFAVAALAKAGAMPVHSWVPDCGEKAPMAVSAFLPASLDKLLGIYLLARTVNGLFESTYGTRLLLMAIGAGTVMCAVMMALVQHDLKRLLSYHAVSQVGYMVLGIGSGTAIGLIGGLFHMLNNAVYKCLLFMCAGAVERKQGTTDLDRLGGLSRTMPVTFATCLIATLAISGVPPLNGFASKWMVYQGIIAAGGESGPWPLWLAAAMFGSALTLASFVKVLHAVFFRKPVQQRSSRGVGEVGPAMWVPMLVLACLCLVFGIFWRALPYSRLLAPVLGQEIASPGVWSAGAATLGLLAAVGLGLVVCLATSFRRPRVCDTYVGGEMIPEIDIPGQPRDATRDLEVSGADFYKTIEGMFPFKSLYRLAKMGAFDIYRLGSWLVFGAADLLRAAHTGRLPAYLTWLLAGLFGLVWWLVRSQGG